MSRLNVELGHSDPEESWILFEKHAHRLIIKSSVVCSACEVRQRRRLRPVVARVLHEAHVFKLINLSGDIQCLHVLGTIMVDAGSRAASVTIHRLMDVEHGLGTSEIMLATMLNHWVKY